MFCSSMRRGSDVERNRRKPNWDALNAPNASSSQRRIFATIFSMSLQVLQVIEMGRLFESTIGSFPCLGLASTINFRYIDGKILININLYISRRKAEAVG